MCLVRVEKIYAKPLGRERIAYKVFDRHDNALWFEFYGKEVEQEKWLTAYDNGTERYPLGFHCFETKKDAEKWAVAPQQVVVKVRIKEIVCCGVQELRTFELNTFVARKMFVSKKDAKYE